jgi:NAD(P)H dehydrogenase (quinone)
MRGVGFLCAPRKRTAFAAHFLMDSSTEASRKAHLQQVDRQMDKLIGRAVPVALPSMMPDSLRAEAAE